MNAPHSFDDMHASLVEMRSAFVRAADALQNTNRILSRLPADKEGCRAALKRTKEAFRLLAQDMEGAFSILREMRDFEREIQEAIENPLPFEGAPPIDGGTTDPSQTDEGFLKSLAKCVRERSAIERLHAYIAVLKGVNAEIAKRRERIAKLAERIRAEPGAQEAVNAKVLKTRLEASVKVLCKRRDAVIRRFMQNRKQALQKITSATAALDLIFPRGARGLALYAESNHGIENSLRILREYQEKFKNSNMDA